MCNISTYYVFLISYRRELLKLIFVSDDYIGVWIANMNSFFLFQIVSISNRESRHDTAESFRMKGKIGLMKLPVQNQVIVNHSCTCKEFRHLSLGFSAF